MRAIFSVPNLRLIYLMVFTRNVAEKQAFTKTCDKKSLTVLLKYRFIWRVDFMQQNDEIFLLSNF